MPREVSTITAEGRVLVPERIQQLLGVGVNDEIEWRIDEDGSIRVSGRAQSTLESVRGAAGSLRSPLPWDRVLQIAREDAARAAADHTDG